MNQLIAKKTKKFTPEELRSTSDSVRKLADNVRIIGELFEDQNKMIGRALRGVEEDSQRPAEDIEAQLMFKGASAGGLLSKDSGFEGFNKLGKGGKGAANGSIEEEGGNG